MKGLRTETLRLLALDIQLADGSHIRGEFPNVSAALNFLMQTGHSSARRDS